MSTVDFASLKERVSIVDALSLLGIDDLQVAGAALRGICPICHGQNKRGFAVTPAKNLFFCFSGCGGGDQITLAAKVKGVSMREAALFLDSQTKSAPAKAATAPQEQRERNQPLQPLAYLEYEHEAVVAVGFDTRTAAELGIGYAGKGIMRGTVAVPIRDEHGALRGYIGIEEARLPKDFQPPENVVPFKKPA